MRNECSNFKNYHSISFYGIILIFSFIILSLIFISVKDGFAQEQNHQLLIGIYPSSPFVFIDNQEPRGFSIDLWKAMAKDLHLDYRFITSTTINGALEDIVEDRVDVALGALSITLIREQLIDFTHPYFHTGLGILVLKNSSWLLSVTLFYKIPSENA